MAKTSAYLGCVSNSPMCEYLSLVLAGFGANRALPTVKKQAPEGQSGEAILGSFTGQLVSAQILCPPPRVLDSVGWPKNPHVWRVPR